MIVLRRAVRTRRWSVGGGLGVDCGNEAYSLSTSPSRDWDGIALMGSLMTSAACEGAATSVAAIATPAMDTPSARRRRRGGFVVRLGTDSS